MHPLLGRPLASYHFDRRKTWPFMIMLGVLMVIGLVRLLEQGLAEEWAGSIMLIAIPGLAIAMVGSELRLKGPIVIIGEEGLLDRRRGAEPVPWEAVQEATIKKRLFGKGIRIVLTGGDRYDIELGLLHGEPIELMAQIQEAAHRALSDETADR